MTNKKVIFIDIDGTLCNNEGRVPELAAEAIIKARENGHQVYLCTGRTRAEIYDFIMEIGFDGVIGASGGYLEIANKVIYNKRVSEENVKHLVDYFNEHKVNFYLESNGGLYGSENLIYQAERCLYGDLDNDELAREKKEKYPRPFVKKVIIGENLYRTDVNKACFLEPKNVSFEEIKKEFEGKFEVYRCTVPAFGDNSGELVVPGVHKAVAIKKMLEILEVDKKDTIAFGDGINDIEMLEYCNLGIAMGNAKEEVKRKANEVTDSHDEGGIYNSFKKHGII